MSSGIEQTPEVPKGYKKRHYRFGAVPEPFWWHSCDLIGSYWYNCATSMIGLFLLVEIVPEVLPAVQLRKYIVFDVSHLMVLYQND